MKINQLSPPKKWRLIYLGKGEKRNGHQYEQDATHEEAAPPHADPPPVVGIWNEGTRNVLAHGDKLVPADVCSWSRSGVIRTTNCISLLPKLWVEYLLAEL